MDATTMESIFYTLLDHYKLTEENCNKQVSDIHITEISESYCEHWRSLPSHLTMKTIAVKDIERDVKHENERRHAFFKKWKEEGGFGATYKCLIIALLEIKCRKDAENICKLLKKSLLVTHTPECSQEVATNEGASITIAADKSTVPDPEVLGDLEQQLEHNLKIIKKRFISFVKCVRDAIKAKGVEASDLCAYLLLACDDAQSKQKQSTFLSGSREDLERATTIDQIFMILSKHTSFLNYDIYQDMLEDYEIEQSSEKLNYAEHLKKYAEMHKVCEFVDINPLLKSFSDETKKVTLKIDLESTSSLAKILDIKKHLSNILGIRKSALDILDIKKGCLLITFVMPASLADIIFTRNKQFSAENVQQFQSLSILWLECNGFKFQFTEMSKDDISMVPPDDIITLLQSGELQVALKLLEDMSQDDLVKLALPNKKTPLHYASQHGQIEVAEKLITDFNYDMESKDEEGCTPLHVAAQYGQIEVIRYFLDMIFIQKIAGLGLADEELAETKNLIYQHELAETHCDVRSNSPLHAASIKGHLDIVRFFTEEIGCDTNLTNSEEQSCLHLATQHGHLSLVRYLVESGCNITLEDEQGRPPTYLAAGGGHLDILRYLIEEKGANPFFTTSREWRALDYVAYPGTSLVHIAAEEGHLKVVKYLVQDKGCDPTATDSSGLNPLHLACQQSHINIVKYLVLEKECDPNSTDNDGISCLHYARSLELVKYLCDELKCSFKSDKDGTNELHFAAARGHLNIVKYLIEEKKFNPNSLTSDHYTPFHCACLKGHLEVVKYLFYVHHCNPQQAHSEQITPLVLAATQGNLEVVKFFVDDGSCDPNFKTGDGITLLNYACITGQLEVVKYLIHKCMCRMEPDLLGMTPLLIAALYGHLHLLTYLIENKKCDPNTMTANGASLLHIASSEGYLEVVKYLYNIHHCNPQQPDFDHHTPLMLAAFNGHLNVFKFFAEDAKCDPNPIIDASEGITVFHYACLEGQLSLVQYLVEAHNCSPMQADSTLHTALHYSIKNLDVLKYLILTGKCDAQARTVNNTTPLHYAAHHGKLEAVKFLVENIKCDPHCTHTGGETPLHEACKCAQTDIAQYLVYNCNCTSDILLRNNHGISALDFLIRSGQHELAIELLFVAAYGLVTVPKPDNLFKLKNDNYTALVTWGIKSVSGHMLFDSLLSNKAAVAILIQLLRMATPSNTTSECTDWNTGSLIVYHNGTRAVIEVSENMSQLHLVMQCVKGKEMHLVEKRSSFITAIKERLRTDVETSEFMLPPQKAYPPEITHEISCPEIANSLASNTPYVSCSNTKLEISISELLHFDSFQLLKEQFFKEILENRASDEIVPDHILNQVCSAAICNDQLHDCLKQQAALHQLTFKQLTIELWKYTIFSEINFLESAYLQTDDTQASKLSVNSIMDHIMTLKLQDYSQNVSDFPTYPHFSSHGPKGVHIGDEDSPWIKLHHKYCT